MNNFEYKNIYPFKWFVLQNFPFIEADFDAITNWQLFCKLGEEINKLINSENSLGNQVENLTNAFIELQNYVNNYFENLDVQEEINNKLDEMAENGELTEIIAQYLQLNGLLCYDSVESMKNAENLVLGSKVKTLNYYNNLKGGGAIYKIINITNDIDVDEMFYIALHDLNLVAQLVYDTNVNVLQLGIKNNFSDDISEKFNIATKKAPLFFPNGIYKVSNTLFPFYSITGENFSSDTDKILIADGIDCTILKSTINYTNNGNDGRTSDNSVIDLSERYYICDINNIAIICNSDENGIYNNYGHTKFNIINVTIVNVKKACGLNLQTTLNENMWSALFYIDNFSAQSCLDRPYNNIGIYVNKIGDFKINNITIFNFKRGILSLLLFHLNNAHIWQGNYFNDDTDFETWHLDTIGITCSNAYLDNIYLDTCHIGIYNVGFYGVQIGNLHIWDDNSAQTVDSLTFYCDNIIVSNLNLCVSHALKYLLGNHNGRDKISNINILSQVSQNEYLTKENLPGTIYNDVFYHFEKNKTSSQLIEVAKIHVPNTYAGISSQHVVISNNTTDLFDINLLFYGNEYKSFRENFKNGNSHLYITTQKDENLMYTIYLETTATNSKINVKADKTQPEQKNNLLDLNIQFFPNKTWYEPNLKDNTNNLTLLT